MAFRNSLLSSPATEPALAPPSYWTGLQENVAKSIFFWGGGHEVMRDSILSVGEKIGEVHGDSTTIITPGAVHEGMSRLFSSLFVTSSFVFLGRYLSIRAAQ